MKLRIKPMIWTIRRQKTTNQNTRRKKNKKEYEASVRIPWDNLKHSNICITGVPEGEKKEQEIGSLFGKNNKRKP